MILDLHNTKHEDVKHKVISFVEKCLTTKTDFTIMIGNSTKMCVLVSKILDEYALEYYVGGLLGIGNSFIKIYL